MKPKNTLLLSCWAPCCSTTVGAALVFTILDAVAMGLMAFGFVAVGLTPTVLAAVGLAAVGLAAVGLAAVGLAAVGLVAVGKALAAVLKRQHITIQPSSKWSTPISCHFSDNPTITTWVSAQQVPSSSTNAGNALPDGGAACSPKHGLVSVTTAVCENAWVKPTGKPS